VTKIVEAVSSTETFVDRNGVIFQRNPKFLHIKDS